MPKKIAKKSAKKLTSKKIKKKVSPKTPSKKPMSASAAKTKLRPKQKISRASKKRQEVIEGVLLGKVEDYYAHVGAIALTLKSGVAIDDTIRVKGHTSDLIQKIQSLQIDHSAVSSANAGDGVGIGVSARCRKGDRVYKI